MEHLPRKAVGKEQPAWERSFELQKEVYRGGVAAQAHITPIISAANAEHKATEFNAYTTGFQCLAWSFFDIILFFALEWECPLCAIVC
jgi:hypothetical protein